MKGMKMIVPVVLVAFLVLGWFSFLTGTVSDLRARNECLELAQESRDAGLYEQAVEFYKEAYAYQVDDDIYRSIKETYDALYAEEPTAFIRNLYIEDMAVAAELHPEESLFWEKQIHLYMDAANYNKAYSVAVDALNHGTKSEELDQLYHRLLYMTKVDYKLYYDFKTALNGYISVYDGAVWYVMDELGEQITSEYPFTGLINDDGKGLYISKVDTRLLDMYEIPRARFDFTPEDAGYYNENCGLMPVKVDGTWKYLNMADKSWLPGGYDIAGSFYGEHAVACKDGVWFEVDISGNQSALDAFADIKLDLYGCHIQNDRILAKTTSDGKYHLFDTDYKQVGAFAADNMDICIDTMGIAFEQNGKWGFVDPDGKILIEPVYAGAKSFANGYAAVCSEDGLWGFINDKYELVIEYAFLDAYYFTAEETCLVSMEEGSYQILEYMFE